MKILNQIEIILLFGILIELIIKNYLLATILLIFLGLIILRGHILTEKFKCKRCGKCCRLNVALTGEDIKRLKKAKKTDFINGKYLKKVKGQCKFLKFKNGKALCQVYNIRPQICRSYPFSKSIFGKQLDPRCRSFFQ